MVSKKIKENKLFKFLTNSYIIIFSSFLVWMFFFDTNVQLNKEFKKEIKELNKPFALLEIEGSNFSFDILSSEKLNLFSKI